MSTPGQKEKKILPQGFQDGPDNVERVEERHGHEEKVEGITQVLASQQEPENDVPYEEETRKQVCESTVWLGGCHGV